MLPLAAATRASAVCHAMPVRSIAFLSKNQTAIILPRSPNPASVRIQSTGRVVWRNPITTTVTKLAKTASIEFNTRAADRTGLPALRTVKVGLALCDERAAAEKRPTLDRLGQDAQVSVEQVLIEQLKSVTIQDSLNMSPELEIRMQHAVSDRLSPMGYRCASVLLPRYATVGDTEQFAKDLHEKMKKAREAGEADGYNQGRSDGYIIGMVIHSDGGYDGGGSGDS